jgi:adenylyl-sulfate kinase
LTSANVRWEHGAIDRDDRYRCLGQCGATVWFTGLPASGKSTLATTLEARLVAAGRNAYLLDGDNLRHGICGDLGFGRDDRDENVRRATELARLFCDSGAIALVALVSPFIVERARAREAHERDGLPFFEVFVNTPLSECARRDPKGLYRRARTGELTDVTGMGSPYEPPLAPDLEVTMATGLENAVEQVLSLLPERPERRGQILAVAAENGAPAARAGR